jgi:hypothetical protein
MSQLAKACCDDLANGFECDQAAFEKRLRENPEDIEARAKLEALRYVVDKILKYKKAMYE